MQVSVENLGALERRMKIEIPEENVADEVSNRLTSLAKTSRIDGFRPGKAPMRILQQRYGQQVRQEVIGEVMRTSFYEAVSNEQLRPAGQPTIQEIDDKPGQGFTFDATFEVYPEIELADPASLSIEKVSCEVEDSDIDEMIETLRKQKQEWAVAERAAQNGDRINIDFRGLLNGEAFEGGSSEGFDLELGSDSFIAGFEEGLIGKSAGDEVNLDLTFPEEYQNKDLAGQAVVFEVKVNSVSEPVLPEVNDDFIVEFGGSTEAGIEGFRNDIRGNMERERDQAVKNRVKQTVLESMLEATGFEVPQALVDDEAERLLEDARRNLMMRGMPEAQTKNIQAAMFNDRARKRVAIGLMMAEVVKQNEFKAEPARVREMIETLAASYETPDEVIKWYYEDNNRLADVESAVLEDDVVNWVLDKATASDAKISFSELMKPNSQAGI